MKRGGVAFLAIDGFHVAVLRPIIDALAGRVRAQLVTDVPEAVRFGPSVLVVPSHRRLERLRRRLPGVWLVNVRHGLIAKRGLQNLADRASARRFDAVCFGDEASETRYRELGATPQEAWSTGYSQMDPLFRGGSAPILGFPPGMPVVLYAPTWNHGLSSAGMLGPGIVEHVRGGAQDIALLIKPHPTIPRWRPEWLAWWQAAAATDPLVRLADAVEDVTPLMLASDLLISDASSTILEFLALDRPIVLITNPDASDDPDYDPDDLPWRWRDLGDEVLDVAQLGAVVRAALVAPGVRDERRRDYRDRLFGRFQDGRNAQRIADRLVDLLGRIDAGSAPPALRFHMPAPSRPDRADDDTDGRSA